MTNVQNIPVFNELCAAAKRKNVIVGITAGHLVDKRTNHERRELEAIVVTDGTTELCRTPIVHGIASAAHLTMQRLGWT